MSFLEGRRFTSTASKLCETHEQRIGSLFASNRKSLITEDVISDCISGYLDRVVTAPLLPINIDSCYEFFKENVKNGIVITIWKSEKVVGFLIASRTTSALTKDPILQQVFFNSTLEGVLAVRAVTISHSILVRIAAARGYKHVISVCSSYDTTFVFNRILQKNGWLSQGHTSVYHIKE